MSSVKIKESLKSYLEERQEEKENENNKATLHTDESLMPRSRLAWSSWNYRVGESHPSTIYWMNNLQHVSDKKDYFISINDPGEVDESKILWETEYTHPLYNVDAIQAQKELPKLNKNRVTFFCGSYFKYGFHEDAFTSGLDAARAITGEPIWN